MIELLASVGEFIGGIAVVISIIYFAVQLRANLNANRAQALSAWTMAASLEKEIIYKDPEFARLFREIVLEGRAPEGDEVVRVYAYLTQYMNSWQLAFMQHSSGVMTKELLERISFGYASYLKNEHVKLWWREMGSAHYDPSFVQYVSEHLVDS